MKVLFISIITTLFFSGCSYISPFEQEAAPEDVKSLELYLRRSSISETDFEQYKISGSRLFYECGMLRTGRTFPGTNNIVSLNEDQLSAFRTKAWEFVNYYNQNKPSLEEPGTGSGMADPGLLTLRIRIGDTTLELKTSVDSVSEKKTPLESRLNGLATLIRSLPKETLCSNVDFYRLHRAIKKQKQNIDQD